MQSSGLYLPYQTAIERLPGLAGEVIGTKGYQLSIRTGNMYFTITQTFQIECPSILKSHTGNTKGVRTPTFNKLNLAAEAFIADDLQSRLGFGCGPVLRHKLTRTGDVRQPIQRLAAISDR